ncbi:MAG: hypothetical protein ACRDBQ_23165 [Shewanella sp.]
MDNLQSYAIDLESLYEGDLGCFTTSSPTYITQLPIEGDQNNIIAVTMCAKTKKEISREIKPKTVYAWQLSK